MTSSQDPPLTRREMRERERLLEQQTSSASPEAAGQTPPVPDAPRSAAVPPPPVPAAPAQSAPTPAVPAQSVPASAVPAPSLPVSTTSPVYAPPRPAGGFGAPAAPFPSAPPVPSAPPAAVPPQNAFAPRPAAPQAPGAAPQPPAQPAPSATSPERTLTRRELRDMLDGHQVDEFDDAEAEAPGATRELPGRAASLPVSAPPMHPSQADDAADSPSSAVGHWTSQLNAPAEAAEPFDQLLSRGGVSQGVPTTTNALILPTLPDHGSFGATPLESSEIIATGSIDLPRSYGAAGVHPSRVDSSDVDRLFDQAEEVSTGAAPVAATRAISTQGAARAMISPPKKEGMNVPLVLAVTAGVLTLGVVATLVIGAVAGLF